MALVPCMVDVDALKRLLPSLLPSQSEEYIVGLEFPYLSIVRNVNRKGRGRSTREVGGKWKERRIDALARACNLE